MTIAGPIITRVTPARMLFVNNAYAACVGYPRNCLFADTRSHADGRTIVVHDTQFSSTSSGHNRFVAHPSHSLISDLLLAGQPRSLGSTAGKAKTLSHQQSLGSHSLQPNGYRGEDGAKVERREDEHSSAYSASTPPHTFTACTTLILQRLNGSADN